MQRDIQWTPITQKEPPDQEPVLVTHEDLPGWFAIGAKALGEWRGGGHYFAGDRLPHEPTHWARLNRVHG